MSREEKFEAITKQMLEIYKAKNKDYDSSVTQSYKEFGMTSFLIRLSDKLNRLKTLNKQEAMVKDEKIEDTLIDLANYAIIALVEKYMEENYEQRN